MNEAEHDAGLAATPGYRYADVLGDELFVAGQVPHDSDQNLVGVGDAAAQATQCLDNLFTLIQVLVVYVADGDTPRAWDAVTDRFEAGVPPATLLGVAKLGWPGQLVEIDATVRR